MRMNFTVGDAIPRDQTAVSEPSEVEKLVHFEINNFVFI